jgi:hypothetical protein
LRIGIRGPRAIGGTPVTISVYVEDVSPEEMGRRAADLADGG